MSREELSEHGRMMARAKRKKAETNGDYLARWLEADKGKKDEEPRVISKREFDALE